jgi:hypothetical protein
VFTALAALVVSATTLVPARARQYASSLVTMRWDAAAEAERAGVRDALVLVRESWGAQLMARMWALGIPRTDAERVYRRVDGCALDERIDGLERTAVRGAAALDSLRPLLADSARVVPSTLSPDASERVLPGATYGARCTRRILEDRAGFTLLAPLLLAGDRNIYARDLHARDTLLLAAYPRRPVVLLRPPSAALGAMPRFERVSRDSLLRAWREEAGGAVEE